MTTHDDKLDGDAAFWKARCDFETRYAGRLFDENRVLVNIAGWLTVGAFVMMAVIVGLLAGCGQ